MREFFRFPDPVNEVAARLVATGVVLLAITILASGWSWLVFVLAFGFLARVACGPRFSPLGLLVTRVLEPRLPFDYRPTPGPPKRFAQGIGAVLSVSAIVLHFGFGLEGLAIVCIAAILAAASLEAFLGYCLGCKIFSILMRLGIIPESVCVACGDISRRSQAPAS